jgi:uracil-DNA glycosylase
MQIYSLHRFTGSAESSVTLRLLEHVIIPPEDGDSIVLVVGHPGANQLGRYFTDASSRNLLLSSKAAKEISIGPTFDDNVVMEDGDSMLMDLATFIE